MSLRWRITATIAVVSALVAVALSLMVHYAYAFQQAEEARELQTERVELALRAYERTGSPALDSRLDSAEVPARLRDAAGDGYTATAITDGDDATAVWAAVPTSDGRVLSLRSSYAPRLDDLAALDRVLLVGSALVVALGAGAGVVMGAGLSARLGRVAAAAGRVAAGDRGTRVSEAVGGSARDEASELARAVDAMADALEARIAAEQRVTADIAHELRTPLTGLSTAADLLGEGRPAELVRDRVAALRALVEDVLEVARLDTATQRPDLSDIALAEFVRHRAARFGPDVTVRSVSEQVVSTDPRRLERILANLLVNALGHGAPPVTVEIDGSRVRIHDLGPGFPDTLLQEGPGRFRKGPTPPEGGGGHGLGLTIACGQAEVLGARLSFANHPDGGALAILDLEPGKPRR
ncbi:histidine kinase [Streptomonospora alba]|uniref:histidine kinase n=1 Tax=Streptomonospora alba TaxID=183763 RepID=A0A0C2JGM7_9ACTN|nr:ATP-binding protein [Streptomonospora alba]KIH98065.1 histidine kinase [Streptomonospora alba]